MVVCANIGNAPSGFEELWVLLSGDPWKCISVLRVMTPPMQTPGPSRALNNNLFGEPKNGRIGPLGRLFGDLKCFTRMRLAGWRDHWPDPGGCSGAEGDRFDELFFPCGADSMGDCQKEASKKKGTREKDRPK